MVLRAVNELMARVGASFARVLAAVRALYLPNRIQDPLFSHACRVSEGSLKALPFSNAKRDTMPFTCQVGRQDQGGAVGKAGVR